MVTRTRVHTVRTHVGKCGLPTSVRPHSHAARTLAPAHPHRHTRTHPPRPRTRTCARRPHLRTRTHAPAHPHPRTRAPTPAPTPTPTYTHARTHTLPRASTHAHTSAHAHIPTHCRGACVSVGASSSPMERRTPGARKERFSPVCKAHCGAVLRPSAATHNSSPQRQKRRSQRRVTKASPLIASPHSVTQ